MKKVTLVLAICSIAMLSNAQVKFGAKAGANFANWVGDDVEGAKMKTGFHVGMVVNIPVNPMFSVQPELYYSDQGFKADGGKLNAEYVNLPILAQYNNASGFYAETGPQIGFLTSAKTKVDGGENVDIKDNMKSTDFAWALGIGYRLASGLGFGARYNFGISKLGDDGEANVKNSVIQVGVHYLFGGK